MFTVVAGSVMLALTLGYAELLRRYGTARAWSTSSTTPSAGATTTSGAFPRPIVALLGVPALTWGTHMRARRRQGWWVCAFGVALTAPGRLRRWSTPAGRVVEAGLAAAYGVVIGLLLGYLLIRADLRLTGPAAGPRGRRLATRGGHGRPARARARPTPSW